MDDAARDSIAFIRLDRVPEAISILEKLSKQHKHPWIKLALAEAYYTADDRDKTGMGSHGVGVTVP